MTTKHQNADVMYKAATYHGDNFESIEFSGEVHYDEYREEWRCTCTLHDEDFNQIERVDNYHTTVDRALDEAEIFCSENGVDVEFVEEHVF